MATNFVSTIRIELDQNQANILIGGFKKIEESVRQVKTAAASGATGVNQFSTQTAAGLNKTAESAREVNKELDRLDEKSKKLADRGRQPLFLQFALFPAAGLAQRLGAQGLASALFTTSDVLGIADNALIIRENIGALATRLRAAGGPIGQIATLAGNLAAPLGATAAGFASTLAVVAPLGIALVGLTALISGLTNQAEERRKRIEAFAQGELTTAELIASGITQDDVRREIGGQQDLLAAQQSRRAGFSDAENVLTLLRDDIMGLAEQYPTIGARAEQLQSMGTDFLYSFEAAVEEYLRTLDLPPGVESIGELIGALELMDNQIDATEDSIVKWTGLLSDPGVMLNTQRANEIAALELQVENTQNAIEWERQLAELRKSGTAQAVQDLIDSEEERLETALALIEPMGDLADLDSQYRDEHIATQKAVVDATHKLADLRNILTEITIKERLAEGFKALFDAGREAVELFRERQEDIAKINEKFQERQQKLYDDYNEATMIAQENYNFDLEKLARDHQARLEEDMIDAQDKERDLREKIQEDTEKDRLEHERRLAKIEREFQLARENAIGGRDALAAYLAKQKRDEEIRDENERYNILLQTRQKDLDKQLEQLKKNLDDQRRQRERDYERRKQELKYALDFEDRMRRIKLDADLRRIQAELQNELTLRNQAYMIELTNLRNHLLNRLGIEQQYFTAITSAVGQLASNLLSRFTQTQTAQMYIAPQYATSPYLTGNSATNPYIGYYAGGRAGGGEVLPYRDYKVGENGPEILRVPVRGHVYTQSQYRQMGGGGMNVSIGNIYGANQKAIIREIERRLVRELSKAGVAA